MPQQLYFWIIALPIAGAMLAVGMLLAIKTARRRQGTRDARWTEVVPVNPLSEDDAARMWRRYALAAATTLVMIGALAMLLLGG